MGPEIIRSLERVLGVLIGGFSVYLGFRLFLALPDKTDSEGRVILPGGVSIFLSRIGPGAFFALFGCILVAMSYYQQVGVDSKRTTRMPQPGIDTSAVVEDVSEHFHGAGESAVPGSAAQRVRLADVRQSLASINDLAMPLVDRLAPSERNSLNRALVDSKLTLIESVWQDEWGAPGALREWIRNGKTTPLPASTQPAFGLFNQGERPR